MKLAISGKGGVGKSTISAAMALILAGRKDHVLAVDADPDANLASALGIPQSGQGEIIPIAERKALVEERTGAKVKNYGQVFKLNPEVADIAENYAFPHNGVSLLVLGAVEKHGGSGCACPESVLLKALVTDLILFKNDALILDMEAGIEHLGRATARGVDCMITVVEPGQRSIDCAHRVKSMAADIGITEVKAIANKVSSEADEAFIREGLGEIELLGSLPMDDGIRAADRDGKSVLDGMSQEIQSKIEGILSRIEEGAKS
ncbi:MAG: ATP-binding protein [Planctomycetota bacterium]|jgi:CO dehydrogenase maturation factor